MRTAFFTALLAALPLASAQGQTTFTADLGRDNAAPPLPAAAGTGSFTLDADAPSLSWDLRVEGVPNVAASHFHNAPAGENGGVVRGFEGSVDDGVWTSTGTWTAADEQALTPQLLEALLAGEIYVNVHTPDYPAGEVRGQLPAEAGSFTADLSRQQAVPPIPAPGGSGTFTLNTAGTELAFRIEVVGVPNVAASHFHNAPAGENGGVVRGFEGSMDGDVWVAEGTWTAADEQPLTPELVDALRAGGIYVNIHTEDYPAGEVRGQVVGDSATAVKAASWGQIKGAQPKD